MVYFYYKLSLPTSDGIPEVIEPNDPREMKVEDVDEDMIIMDSKRFTMSPTSNGSGSFARLLENDTSQYIKERENEIFNRQDLTDNQRFLAQAAERMSLRSSYDNTRGTSFKCYHPQLSKETDHKLLPISEDLSIKTERKISDDMTA